ncbi:uncharacterized protein LOC112589561 [Harpegnathos saltator]|uniref:uncharacterized protein LOC112589561 n=1 Tax=Harpegnathos saltator TaxID=610380 RepID=UPI000DBEE4E5|nr:uncharacterized protein LOC112589561 [Harpegnathos saltator]
MKHIKEEVRQILDGLLQNLEYEEKNYENNMYKTLRLLGTRWACKLGHRKCQITATTKLSGYLLDPDKNKFSPWWKDWVYCAGMSLANEAISQMFFEKYKNTADIDILKYLFCSDNAQIIIKYMEEVFLELGNVLSHKNLNELYRIVIKKHIRKNDVLKYFIQHYSRIIWWQDTFVQNAKVLGNMIMNVYLNEDIRVIVEFANKSNSHKINLDDIYRIVSVQRKRIQTMQKIIYSS